MRKWLPKKSPGAKAGDKEKQLRGELPAKAVYTKVAHAVSLLNKCASTPPATLALGWLTR